MDDIPLINIEKIESRFLRRFGDFGIVFSKLKFVPTTEIPTAATDGKNIYYNPKFMSKLSVNQQTFIVGHEVLHVAFNHLKRSKDRDNKLWNIATDAVINAMLVDQGLEMVSGGIDMPEGLTMNAEQIYQKLLNEKNSDNQQKQNNNREKQQQGQENGSQGNNQQEQGNSQQNQENSQQNQENDEFGGHAAHNLWKKVFEKPEKNNQNQQEQNNGQEQDNSQQNQEKNEDEQNIDETEIYKKIKQTTEEAQEQRKKDRLESAVSPEKARSRAQTMIGIGYQKPVVSWQSILRAATRGEQDFSYAKATVDYGVLQPHLDYNPKPETEILLDTSGSISEHLLKSFLRECKNIFSRSKIKAGCFDTRFYGFHEIKKLKDIDSFVIEGRGGTNFDVAINAFSRRAENHVIFTDGFAEMPQKSDRAVWVVFGDAYRDPKKINPKGALKVIYISKEEYRKLCQTYIKEEEYER